MSERRARYVAYQAVQAGELMPEPCERCGRALNVQGHHDDYAQPLAVRWLCVSCHRIHHRGAPDRDELISAALFLEGEGMAQRHIAVALGVSRSTMYGWFDRVMRHPDGGWHEKRQKVEVAA